MLETLLNKFTGLIQVFSCEICEIFKNTFFYRIPPVTASKLGTYSLRKDLLRVYLSLSFYQCRFLQARDQ